MNRTDFQQLSEVRLKESKALLAAGFPDGAYYLAGYAVECALKACIAKRTQLHDFPEKGSHRYYSHDLEDLFGFADLRLELEQALAANQQMNANWIVVKNWSEESRYESGRAAQDAQDLLRAIEDHAGGLLPWLQQRW
jgi:HEPN domain-containing protein